MSRKTEQVRTFMQQFIETEHAAYRAMLMEPDETLFLNAWKALNVFGAIAGLNVNVARFPDEPLPAIEEAKEELLSSFALRRLIRIERYDIQGESIYTVYTTCTESYDGDGVAEKGIWKRYTIEEKGSKFFIVRQQDLLAGGDGTWHVGIGKEIALSEKPEDVVVYIEEENMP